MFGLRYQLADHGLDHGDIAVEKAADSTSQQSNPKVGGDAYHNHAEHGPDASQQEDRLAADAVGETAPVHAHQGLREGEGGDEETGVEGCIFLAADFEPLDELPGVGEDGGEGDRLG